MSNTITLEKLEKCLNQLLECNALEMISDNSNSATTLYIPYMMNDALEYYFILENCQITGIFTKTIPADTTLETSSDISDVSKSRRNALIFHKADNEILTIWFSRCSQILNFYQYHRIGHFWREGQEHWRRLVYIIGTIHEKYTYLGRSACNKNELALLSLVEFAPFRYWSPIHESLDDYYSNSKEGLLYMYELAQEAGDKTFARLIQLYRKMPFHFMTHILARKLISPKRESLYQLICQKINLCSTEYALRDYGAEKNAEIKKLRTQFSEKLYADGFIGQYPYFQKDSIQLVAMEEHPFTILESANFTFRIQGMVTDGCHHYLYKTI